MSRRRRQAERSEEELRAAAEETGIEILEEAPARFAVRIARGQASALPYVGAAFAGLTLALTGGLLLGNPEGSDPLPLHIILPVLGFFWLMLIGVLLFAVRQRTLIQTVEVRGDRVEFHAHSALGRKEKWLSGPGLKVDRRVVYNMYRRRHGPPVSFYRIRITGPEGRVKFGTGIPDDIQRWLMRKLTRAIKAAASDRPGR